MLRTTDRGRIFSYSDPALGTTANTAFVAVAYATLLKPYGDPLARTYTCWALQQERPPLVPYLALPLPEHELYACAQRSTCYPIGQPKSVRGDPTSVGLKHAAVRSDPRYAALLHA